MSSYSPTVLSIGLEDDGFTVLNHLHFVSFFFLFLHFFQQDKVTIDDIALRHCILRTRSNVNECNLNSATWRRKSRHSKESCSCLIGLRGIAENMASLESFTANAINVSRSVER